MRYHIIRFVTQLAAIALFAVSAKAAVEMEMVAVDGDVLLTGSGTLNLSSTTDLATSGTNALSVIDAAGSFSPSAVTGSNAVAEVRVECGGVTGPTTLGTGADTWKGDEGSGDTVGIYGDGESYGASGDGLCVLVPLAYVSGAQLNGSTRFINSSLSSLGVTKGAYRWTWGTGAFADSLTLYIGGKPLPSTVEPPAIEPPMAVPTVPRSLMLVLMILLALLGVRRARR
jgi:hypothetical protein